MTELLAKKRLNIKADNCSYKLAPLTMFDIAFNRPLLLAYAINGSTQLTTVGIVSVCTTYFEGSCIKGNCERRSCYNVELIGENFNASKTG